jgi:hypothetical protein
MQIGCYALLLTIVVFSVSVLVLSIVKPPTDCDASIVEHPIFTDAAEKETAQRNTRVVSRSCRFYDVKTAVSLPAMLILITQMQIL